MPLGHCQFWLAVQVRRFLNLVQKSKGKLLGVYVFITQMFILCYGSTVAT